MPQITKDIAKGFKNWQKGYMCDEHKAKNAKKLGLILILVGAIGLAVSLFFHEMGMAIPSLMAALLITIGSFRVLSTYNAD